MVPERVVSPQLAQIPVLYGSNDKGTRSLFIFITPHLCRPPFRAFVGDGEGILRSSLEGEEDQRQDHFPRENHVRMMGRL